MNKKLWILPVALLAVFGLVLTACPEGELGETWDELNIDLVDELGTSGTLEVTLADNFTYGSGYQGKIQNIAAFATNGIREGQEYEVTLEFTVTGRNLAGDLQCGFVDENPSKGYWYGLTWASDEGGEPQVIAPAGATPYIMTGTTVTASFTLTARAHASGAGPNFNTFMFQTEEPQTTEPKLVFTQFTIHRPAQTL